MTSHFAETLTLMPIECHETVCFSGGVYTASDRYEKSTKVFEIVSSLLRITSISNSVSKYYTLKNFNFDLRDISTLNYKLDFFLYIAYFRRLGHKKAKLNCEWQFIDSISTRLVAYTRTSEHISFHDTIGTK